MARLFTCEECSHCVTDVCGDCGAPIGFCLQYEEFISDITLQFDAVECSALETDEEEYELDR